ncbi:dTDP-4-dehydrorhamnose reductase [Blastochloris sulfoviridis]|uniref:dTDP-4-dehydrorhamnose reductase n=1 Tax=Blastochloris sulfoviridis TaxID=50712 RepID=A0A5M6I2G2_9HYPH|nr:dTDP-4-dehydrorhamnose reductase [Blastochloris sulfoviridis]KAA5602077.1 dTDP-4-dehydrorhamnose reductase [Blastochloris sulfoviridis]
MRILLTGISGQVGAALLPVLGRLGTVVAADRARLDLARPQAIAAALDALSPDLIVNPAAYTAVDRAEDERDLAFRVNAEAPGAMARWAAARGVPLVQFSTDYVYDGGGTQPWREDDSTGPLCVYGASKLAGEAAVRAAGGPHLVVRTSWVYAASGANFLRTMARLARERSELRVVADQIGAPTSAALISDALVKVLASAQDDIAGRFAAASGLVHLAASGETSWHGFAAAIVAGLRARGVPLKVEAVTAIATADYPTKAHRPANSRLDLGRLSTVFGVTTPDWEAALQPELDRLAAELRG